MTLSALICKRESGKPANANPANPAKDGQGKAGTLARLATLALARPTSPEVAPLPDPAAEARRQRVLAMLADRPGIRYAVLANNLDTDPVLVTIGIRDVGTCELAIPAANYDAFALLALIERHGATVH